MEDLYFHVLQSVDACYGSSPKSSCVASHQFIQLLSALPGQRFSEAPHNPHLPPPNHSLTHPLPPALLPFPPETQHPPPRKQTKEESRVLTSPTLRLTLLRHRLLRPLRLRLLYQLALLIVLGIYLVNFRFRR